MHEIVINTKEEFQHLAAAPIVEAVIDIRVQANKAFFDEDTVRSFLEKIPAGYKLMDKQRSVRHEVTFGRDNPSEWKSNDLGCKGLRFQADDQASVVQFNQDGFNFSQLAPYKNWKYLLGNSLTLWEIFFKIINPPVINRIGLRYINRIDLPQGESGFEKYINPAPESPRGLPLPFYGYMHHDAFAVPGHPYRVNLIQTIQKPQGQVSGGIGLIIDIDVFMPQPVECDYAKITTLLNEMRWVKNKVFFGSITDKAKDLFV